MKKTFAELRDADQLVASLFAKEPALVKSRFGYAWKNFIKKNYDPLFQDFREEIEEARLQNALEDERTHELLLDAKGGFKFSREGMLNLTREVRKIQKAYDAKVVEIKPVLSPFKPKLEPEELEMLKGLVL